ncbi:hypothetical protein O181_004435 [Austropuccinia psidii MF-1]|uniref:Uncharacterized protein n=1 Tax=Austropuccinia psidii MF-1 TaxID=1389203 RepID=A0A9Q3BGD5_9BASI|nr:hypothetical protein [Austropuccinia psidii MF-1]
MTINEDSKNSSRKDSNNSKIFKLKQFTCRPNSKIGTIKKPVWNCWEFYRYFKLLPENDQDPKIASSMIEIVPTSSTYESSYSSN